MAKRKKRKTTGLPPGSLVFTGEQQSSYSNLTLLEYSVDFFEHHVAKDQLPMGTRSDGIRWYDLRGLHNVALVKKMGELFSIHPLVLEDILDTNQRPKFEEYEDGLFITIQDFTFEPATLEVKKEQVTIYVMDKVVLSFQEDDQDIFTTIRQRFSNAQSQVRRKGTDYLAYALLDRVVDNYFIILDQIEHTLDEMEASILERPDQAVKSKIHALKLSTLSLRRAISAIRSAVGDFSRSEHALIAENTNVFLRDLYDHTIQVQESTDAFRDLIQGLYELYLSEISLKMNSIMQVLTIISTIFIPLSFLTGVYGMNFERMPELHSPYGYFVLWGVMILVFIGSLLYFRQKKWL
ncbi:MAG: magnesium/cobalt transporter CorA [Bacteroidota bacterium]